MTDKNLKKGDEGIFLPSIPSQRGNAHDPLPPNPVSWKWGSSGHPSGTVAEIKTHGSLEIESKGKRVRRNADLDNPAVHVAREGNDVVKRASELTKESSAPCVEKRDKKTMKEGMEEKKMTEAGEKRDRSDADVNGDKSSVEEQLEAEKGVGKEAKKPKLDEKVKEKDGNGEDKITAPAETEDSPVPKKRGPGRPKKSEIEARKREAAERLKSAGGAEKISQRTRSKA